MTISELQIQFDLNKGNERALLEEHARWTAYCYFFVDSKDGHCYLLDENGKMDDNKKITILHEIYVKKDIKKIVIPNGVKSIGDWAFDYCRSLKNVEIPKSVKSIGNGAFYNCNSLANIKIPNGVESIEDYTFHNCTSLKSIEIPESVKSIGDGSFCKCKSLTSVEIPNGVKSIRDSAFWNCTSLEEVIFNGKTIDQVKAMKYYPWEIKDEAIIKCQKS